MPSSFFRCFENNTREEEHAELRDFLFAVHSNLLQDGLRRWRYPEIVLQRCILLWLITDDEQRGGCKNPFYATAYGY